MEYELIQSFKSEIRKINRANKNDKGKQIKEGIAIYSWWMQLILWFFLVVCIASLVTVFILTFRRNFGSSGGSWIGVCFLSAIISMAVIMLISSVFSRIYAKEGLEADVKRLNVLKALIKRIYSGEALLNKVEALIDIYQQDVDELIAEEAKKNKVFGAVLTIMGTVVATSFEGMEKLGVGIEGWLAVISCLLIIGLFTIAPLYLITLINPTKDKYRLMLKRLKHLRIILLTEEEAENRTEKKQDKGLKTRK